jgi:hypothetical protein
VFLIGIRYQQAVEKKETEQRQLSSNKLAEKKEKKKPLTTRQESKN